MLLFRNFNDIKGEPINLPVPPGTLGGPVVPYFGFANQKRTKPDDETALWPVAYYAETDDEGEIPPHYHRADQFQIFTRNSGGYLGGDPVQSVTVHYANAYTPYGPLTARGQGMRFLTLRKNWDPGGRDLRKFRSELPKVKRRYVICKPVPPVSIEQLKAMSSVETLHLIESDDGLGAWLHRIPPGGKVVGPDPATGAGQYWIVITGTLAHENRAAGELSCAFLDSAEAAFTAQAGDTGLEILALQYPIPGIYGAPPVPVATEAAAQQYL